MYYDERAEIGLLFLLEAYMKVNKLPFIVQRDGMKIECTAYRRNDMVCTKQIPVILCHGFTSDQRSTAPYAERLAEHGFAAFTFDFIGGGFETKSDGTMMDMTVFTEIEDLKARLQQREKELLGAKQENESLRQHQAASQQALMARLASLESPSIGTSSTLATNQSREAKLVKLPSWMRLGK